MAELKTKPTKASVKRFVDAVPDAATREDCRAIVKMMRDATGADPVMWGPAIIGFGACTYRSPATGRESAWFVTGFSPRKANLTLYLMAGFPRFAPLMSKLGKHSHGKGCLYIKRLSDVDTNVLRELVEASVEYVRTKLT